MHRALLFVRLQRASQSERLISTTEKYQPSLARYGHGHFRAGPDYLFHGAFMTSSKQHAANRELAKTTCSIWPTSSWSGRRTRNTSNARGRGPRKRRKNLKALQTPAPMAHRAQRNPNRRPPRTKGNPRPCLPIRRQRRRKRRHHPGRQIRHRMCQSRHWNWRSQLRVQ